MLHSVDTFLLNSHKLPCMKFINKAMSNVVGGTKVFSIYQLLTP